MRHREAISWALLQSVLFGSGVAWACIHAPVTYKDVVSEQTKEALLFHDGTNAHLVIKTNLKATTALPSSMAWVIPLPSLPSRYEEVDPGLFRELFEVADAAAPKFESFGETEDKIRVHPTRVVGNYQVQPIEVLSEEAGSELNAWLTQKGFSPVPVENQKYYLRRGAVFLAVKINRLTGDSTDLKPLHITYRADRLVLPLKFSTHSGGFDVMLYTFTPQRLELDFGDPASSRTEGTLERYGLFSDGSIRLTRSQLRNRLPALFKLVGPREGYLTLFTGRFNKPDDDCSWGPPVSDLPEDPGIDVRRDAKATSGEGYVAAGAKKARQQHRLACHEKIFQGMVREAEALGPQSPRLADSLSSLAWFYTEQGRYAEAEPLYKRALAIRETTWGPEHPDVATSLENYAALLRQMNRNSEAAEMEARVKAIRAKRH